MTINRSESLFDHTMFLDECWQYVHVFWVVVIQQMRFQDVMFLPCLVSVYIIFYIVVDV